MKIFFKLLGDFRYLCFALLISHFYWLFFSTPDWFVKQFYLSLVILTLGCIFSKQRLIFGILLFSEDTKKKINQEQIKTFQKIIAITKQKKIKPLFHLANSAAVLNFKQSYFDIVRIGLIIYGVRHFVKIEDSFCLKPVLSMHSYILSLKTIPKGRAVSYSCSWIAPKKCNIALVPMGYSDESIGTLKINYK